MKNPLIALSAALLILFNLYSPTTLAAGKLEQIKQNGLRVCLEPGYMPFEMADKQGKLIGFDIDLTALLIKELGAPKLDLVNTAWDDIIPALLADKCDIIINGMSITDERSQKVDFTSAYIAIGQTVLLRKELADKVKSYIDLNDPKYKVITKEGTTSETVVKEQLPKAQYITIKLEGDAVTELLNGKVDAFIYDSPYNATAFGQRGQGKLVFLDSPFTFEPIGMAIRKGDPEFLDWLNHFIQTIQRNGTRQTLYNKWFKNTNWLKDLQQASP